MYGVYPSAVPTTSQVKAMRRIALQKSMASSVKLLRKLTNQMNHRGKDPNEIGGGYFDQAWLAFWNENTGEKHQL